MIVFIFLIGLAVWLIFRYCGPIASTFLSLVTRCEISVGDVRWMRLFDVRITLPGGARFHVDHCVIQFFSHQVSKPIRICLGDVRIEAEPHMFTKKKESSSSGSEVKSSSKKLLLLIQYCGFSVNCIHLVLLDAVPGCMVHLSVDEVAAEAFRSREGWQLELSSRLAQGKVLRRRGGADGVVASFTLPFQLSLDIAPSRLKKIGLRVADPSLALHEGIFKVINDWDQHRRHEQEDKNPLIEATEAQRRKIPFLENCELAVSLCDCAMTYFTAETETIHRKSLSLRFAGVDVKSDGGSMQCRFSMLGVADSLQRNVLNSAQLSVTVFNQQAVLEIGLSTDSVMASLSLPEIIWWRKHFLDATASIRNNKEVMPSSPRKALASIWCTVEVDSLTCQITDSESFQSCISIQLLTFNKNETSIEFGVDSLVISNWEASTTAASFNVHKWGHVVYIGVAIIQYSCENQAAPCLLVCVDDCKLEWSDELAKQVQHLLRLLREASAPSKHVKAVQRITVKIKAKRASVVLLARKATFLCWICDELALELSDETDQIVASLRNAKIGIGNVVNFSQGFSLEVVRQAKKQFPPPDGDYSEETRTWSQAAKDKVKNERRRAFEEQRSQGIKLVAQANILCVSVSKASPVIRDVTISSNAPIYFTWSPLLHRVLYHVKCAAQEIVTKASNSRQPRKPPTIVHLKMLTNFPVSLDMELPRYHRMVWRIPSLTFDKSSSGMSALSPQLNITMNGHNVVTALNVCITKRLLDTKMEAWRRGFGNLELITNKVWTWAADSFLFHLPFEFNFHQVFDELKNCIKWIRIVHGMEKKEFTKDSPLPADIRIVFKEVKFEMDDDPFENLLQTSHELREDEVYECERRRQMLSERLVAMKKANPLFPQSKVDELQVSLMEKNSQIFIERWKKAGFTRRPLFVSKWTGWEIRAFADPSLHGTDICTSLMHGFDPLSYFPSNGLKFSTLWGRAVEFDIQEWQMNFKDYPMPYFLSKDMHFFGTLIGAEQFEEGSRSLRECKIELPPAWEQHTVLRNMCPLKYYYDMQCETGEWNCTYGPCWEPCLSTISQFWNNVSAPSKDPSPILPFWDKMRFLLHGRFSWLCSKVVTTMLASPDPYNSTENLEICWEDFGLDWALGEIRIRTGLRVFVRTASRYDDSRILNLPDLKLRVGLDWICGGDPHDHHSVTPCSPHRLPHYSTDHDSYRAFRSHHLDLSFSFDVGAGEQGCGGEKMPQILLYANTFRSFEFLMKTLTVKNRNIRRGKVFGIPANTKPQLSKHFRNVQVSVNLPKFFITYWMKHSSDFGFRVISDGLNLSLSLKLSMNILANQYITRRRTYAWAPQHVSASLWGTEVHVFGPGRNPSAEDLHQQDSLLLGISRVTYIRENGLGRGDGPLHRLTAQELKASWTAEIRDACLSIADGVHRAHLLRRILSNDAIKILNLHDEEEECTNATDTSTTRDDDKTHRRGYSISDTNQSMLNKLIEEASTRLVAHCEQATDLPTDSLQGVLQCTTDDVAAHIWQIDLLNGQVALKGSEKGFVLISAARASLAQKIHKCVWRGGQLLGKKSWSAVISGMQYFAPLGVSSGEQRKGFSWLPNALVEEKGHETPLDDLSHYIAAGEAAGSFVDMDRTTDLERLQLQRVVSRCSCEIYFCYFSDELKTDALEEIGVNKTDNKEDSPLGGAEPGVDTLTLKHNLLEVSTSSEQFEILVDIVNTLVLFIDPKKKELAEHRRRLRFSFLLMELPQMRESIVEQQSNLRDIVAIVRSLERQLFYLDSQDSEDPEKRQQVIDEMEEYKVRQLEASDQLAISISCYKQRQVEATRVVVHKDKMEDDGAPAVVRRFEVCFEDCTWKLTESDGQIGLAETQIRNFLYTRTVRLDNCGEHLFEVGSVRIANLLPDTPYRDTLHRDERVQTRQPAIRLLLKDMAPVGGICVKEHFEVNIAPMMVQLTYEFFEKMMTFFFPGKNIHKDDNLEAEESTPVSSKFSFTRRFTGTLRSTRSMPGDRKQSNGNNVRQIAGKALQDMDPDDIEKMRQRAHNNNFFIYIKIPEVPFVVSYKGREEKNIEDVDRFGFLFPLCEFHEKNWTWLDLSLAVKQRCKRVLLQQFMKQKLLRNRLITGGPEMIEGISEEEKKRIALGSTEEKKKKK